MRAGPGIATVKDHYAILGVARDAPIEVIRAAYRVLVQKYHPDRNRDPDAGGRAEEINTAYAVLKDPGARARYDQELPRAAGRRPSIPEIARPRARFFVPSGRPPTSCCSKTASCARTRNGSTTARK